MKYSVLMWLMILLVLSEVQGQSQPVTYDFQNTSLAEVIEELKRQTKIDFAYDNFALAKIQITGSGNNQTLQQALTAILVSTDYHFVWVGQTCIIAKHLKEPTIAPASYQDILKTIAVAGTVYDSESHESLPFVGIYNLNSKQGFMTNEYGMFHCSFQMAHPEDTIAFQFVGYETKKLLLSQLNASSSSGKVELIPRRLYLPVIMVNANSNPLFERDVDHAHLVFNPNDLATSEALGEADVFRSAQLLPGVSANQENSDGLLIRGSNADQTLMQLDGFTIYHQDHLFGMFSAVNSHAVKSIRLHKSTPHSRHGGRIGGLLEMVGKEGSTQKGITQINLGMLSGSLSIEGPLDSARHLGFIFNGRRAFTDGWYSPTYQRIFSTVYNSAIISNDDNKTFEGQNDPSFYFQDANIKLTWKPSEKHTFNASLYNSRDQLYIHYADTSEINNALSSKVQYTDESRWKNSGLSLHYVYHQSPNAHFFVRLTLSDYKANYFSTDSVLSFNQVETTLIQNIETNLRNLKITTEKQWSKLYHTITLGAESEQVISQREYAYHEDEIPKTQQNSWWHSLYLQDDWSPSLRWRLHSGLRTTYDKRTSRLLPEPRLTIVYRWPLRRIRTEVGYARVHQLIHRVRAQNLYQNNPDYWALSDGQNIPVLASHQLNFGIQKDFTKGHIHMDLFSRLNEGSTLFLASLPGYDQAATRNENDLIVRGKSQSHGIEVSGFVQHRRHQILASYAWLSSTGMYDGIDNQLIVSSQEHRNEWKFYYQWQVKHWSAGIFWTYGSGRPYTPLVGVYSFDFPNGESNPQLVYGNFNSKRLPAYHRMDVTIEYHWSGKRAQSKLGLSIYNVYNRTNIRSTQYFLAPDGNSFQQNDLRMLGLVPSLQMQIRF